MNNIGWRDLRKSIVQSLAQSRSNFQIRSDCLGLLVQLNSEKLQGWRLRSLFGHPPPVLNRSWGEEFFSCDHLYIPLFQLLFSNFCPPFIVQPWEQTACVSPISSPLERIMLSPNLPTPSSKHLWRNGIQALVQVVWELATKRSETKECLHWSSGSHTAPRHPAADVLSWSL